MFIFRGAQACVLAFSCTDRESFKSVGKWKRKVEEECFSPMVTVKNKMDCNKHHQTRCSVSSKYWEPLEKQLRREVIPGYAKPQPPEETGRHS